MDFRVGTTSFLIKYLLDTSGSASCMRHPSLRHRALLTLSSLKTKKNMPELHMRRMQAYVDKRASEETSATVKKAGGGSGGDSNKRARAPSPEVDATELAKLSKFKFKYNAVPDQCFKSKLGDGEAVTYVAAVLKWGKDNEQMALNAPVVAKWSC
jgi:hypothetical protein